MRSVPFFRDLDRVDAARLIGALEVVRSLNDHGVTTTRPFETGFFTDEEGARFGTDMLGSAVAVGRIPFGNSGSTG